VADLVVEGTKLPIWREKFCTDGFMLICQVVRITHDPKSFVSSISFISFVLFMSMADYAFVPSNFYTRAWVCIIDL
jgi:hypothetical protein